MESEALKSLADLGSAGAVLTMAFVFVRYLGERAKAEDAKDEKWLALMTTHMSEEIKAFTALTVKVDDCIQDKKK